LERIYSGDLISTGTAKQRAEQLLFKDLKDMHDFMIDKKHKILNIKPNIRANMT